MEAYHTPTGYEGVPAPTRKEQARQRKLHTLRSRAHCFEEVLEIAYAQEQSEEIISWLKYEARHARQAIKELER